MTDENELKARIYAFPNSMLKQNGRKINYVQFMRECDDSDFRASYQRLAPLVQKLDFAAMLAEVPYLTDLQRRFYRVYLEARQKTMF